jgi:phosphate-selective porin OprO/OprP
MTMNMARECANALLDGLASSSKMKLKSHTRMKTAARTLGILPFAFLCPSFAETVDATAIKAVWDTAILYNIPDNHGLQKFAITGRLHGDYENFEESEQGSVSGFIWRRFRTGFKAFLFENLTVKAEADMNLHRPEPLYNRLTDAYVSGVLGDGLKITVGKQAASFTLDGSTSSNKLIAIERSKITDNLWFSKRFFSGATISGKRNQWESLAGLYSSDGGPEFDEVFRSGHFTLLSLGYNLSEQLVFDNALVRIDYVKQEEDLGNATGKNKNIVSFVTRFDNSKRHLWTDLTIADGYAGQADLLGLQFMPFYDITDKTQAVFRYTHLKSSGGNAIKLGKYEKSLVSGKGNKVSEYFCGINHYFHGHKLKWQNGIQYTGMKAADSAGSKYNGWGFTSAVRISW